MPIENSDMVSSLLARIKNRENGFNLIEVILVAVILGIISAVAVPIFLNAQSNARADTVKLGLTQASAIVERTKADLDGLYPKYVPNAIIANSLWKNFAYTYSDDRSQYCLQGTASDGKKYFVGSASHLATSNDCSLPNIGTNSANPWGIIDVPQIPVDTATFDWPAGSPTATGTANWTAAACSAGTPTYQVKFTDQDTGAVYTSGSPVTGTSYTTTVLTSPNANSVAFYPEDTVTASVVTTCVVTYGSKIFSYPGNPGPGKNGDIPALPIPTASYATNGTPTAIITGTKMTASAAFNPITCPIGVAKYQVKATEPGGLEADTALAIDATKNWTLTSFTSDVVITYTGNAYCSITRPNTSTHTSDYPSNTLTGYQTAPIGIPLGSLVLNTSSAYATSGTTPNGLSWTTVTCPTGGTANYTIHQTSSPATDGPTTTDLGVAVTWDQGTSHTYTVSAVCKGQNTSSDAVTSAPLSFTTDVSVPTPTYTTNPAAVFLTSSQMTVQATFAAVNCPAGTVYYQVAATQGSQPTVLSGRSTSPTISFTLPTTIAADTLIAYKGYAYCDVTQYDGSTKTYTSSAVSTSEYTPVAPPTQSTLSAANQSSSAYPVNPNILNASSVTCPYGGTVYYRFSEPGLGTGAPYRGGWQTSNSFTGTLGSAGDTVNALTSGKSYTFGVATECQGTNRTSSIVSGTTVTVTASDNPAPAPSAPTNVTVSTNDPNSQQYVNWNAVTCSRNATPYYLISQNIHNSSNTTGYNSSWQTGTSFNSSGWIDKQGYNYQYTVYAECVNSAGTSASSGGGQSGQFAEGVAQPGSVGAVYNNGQTYIAWSGVGCGSGTNAYYYPIEQYHNGSQVNWGTGWTSSTGYTIGSSPYINGYEQWTVNAECVSTGNGASSNSVGTGAATGWTFSQPYLNSGSVNFNNYVDRETVSMGADVSGGSSNSVDSCVLVSAPPGLSVSSDGNNGCNIYGSPNGTYYASGYNVSLYSHSAWGNSNTVTVGYVHTNPYNMDLHENTSANQAGASQLTIYGDGNSNGVTYNVSNVKTLTSSNYNQSTGAYNVSQVDNNSIPNPVAYNSFSVSDGWQSNTFGATPFQSACWLTDRTSSNGDTYCSSQYWYNSSKYYSTQSQTSSSWGEIIKGVTQSTNGSATGKCTIYTSNSSTQVSYYGHCGMLYYYLDNLVPGHNYTASCVVGGANFVDTTSSSGSGGGSGMAYYGLAFNSDYNAADSNTPYSTSGSYKLNPGSLSWYTLSTSYTPGGNTGFLKIMTINTSTSGGGTGEHEWFARNCYINY